jgi:hypothetical protein
MYLICPQLLLCSANSERPEKGPTASGFASRASGRGQNPPDSAQTPRVLGNGKAFGVLSPTRDHSMLNKYRLFQRANGVFY